MENFILSRATTVRRIVHETMRRIVHETICQVKRPQITIKILEESLCRKN